MKTGVDVVDEVDEVDGNPLLSSEFTCHCGRQKSWIRIGQTTKPCPYCGLKYFGVAQRTGSGITEIVPLPLGSVSIDNRWPNWRVKSPTPSESPFSPSVLRRCVRRLRSFFNRAFCSLLATSN